MQLAGDTGEGGGQILRTAITMALATGRGFEATRIRANRPQPGLKAQHAAILRTVAAVTGSQATGVHVGSSHVTFTPGNLEAGTWTCDVGTAGAASLVLQTLLPLAVLTPGATTLELTGGTDVPFAPTLDWTRWTYVPYLAALADIDVVVERRGFAPRGGGVVRVAARSNAPEATGQADEDLAKRRAFVRLRLGTHRHVQGEVVAIHGSSLVADGLPPEIADRQALGAHAQLLGLGVAPAIERALEPADSLGTSVTLCLTDSRGNRLGHDRLGARGVRAEDVGAVAARSLVEDWRAGATVDRHMADHVVPWVALGAGAVRIPHATPHVTTNAWVCNAFLGDAAVRVDRNLVR